MKRTLLQLDREPGGVGGVGFLERVQPMILSRRETEIVQEQSLWVLKEDAPAYGQEMRLENASKALR